MPHFKSGISDKIRRMVQKINQVGVNNIRDYCDKHRHKLNFRRQLEIVRTAAQKGYTYAAYDLGMTRQGVELALKRMYGIALAVEKEVEDGK